MNKAFLGSVAALASLLVGATVGASAAEAAATEVSRIDFETGTIDASPLGFTAELTGKGKPVRWVVLEDAERTCRSQGAGRDQRRQHEQSVPAGHSRRLRGQGRRGVGPFQAGGRQGRSSGRTLVRLQDADNYYIARANALENNVRLYRVVDGAASSSLASTCQCRTAAGRP